MDVQWIAMHAENSSAIELFFLKTDLFALVGLECGEGHHLPVRLLQHTQQQLERGEWRAEYIYYTEVYLWQRKGEFFFHQRESFYRKFLGACNACFLSLEYNPFFLAESGAMGAHACPGRKWIDCAICACTRLF